MIKKLILRHATHFVVKHLLKTITEEDVLRPAANGGIMVRGKVISREQQEQLEAEAEYIKNSVTMKLLLKDMEYLAHQTMFEKSSSFDDMLFGKAMLYVIDILKKKIHNLAK